MTAGSEIAPYINQEGGTTGKKINRQKFTHTYSVRYRGGTIDKYSHQNVPNKFVVSPTKSSEGCPLGIPPDTF